MSITFTRAYSRAVVVKTDDGLQDVVTSVYCAVYATDEETGIRESMGDEINLNPPDPTQFIPFEQITVELLDSWVMPKNQYVYMESRLTDAVNLRLNPPVIIKDLPFNVVVDETLPIESTEPVIEETLPIESTEPVVDETSPAV